MLYYGSYQSKSNDFQVRLCEEYINVFIKKDFFEKQGRNVSLHWTLRCADENVSRVPQNRSLLSAYILICLFKRNSVPLANESVLQKTQKELIKLCKHLGENN